MKTLQNEVHHPDERSEKVAERRTCFKYSQDALTEFCKKEVNGEEVDFRPTNTPFQLGKSLKDLIERGILSTVEEGLAWQIRKDIQAEIDENKRKAIEINKKRRERKKEQAMAQHERSNSGLSGGRVQNSGHVEQHYQYNVHYHGGIFGAEGSGPGMEDSKGQARSFQKSGPQQAKCGSANSTAATKQPVDNADTAAGPPKRPRSSALVDFQEQPNAEARAPPVHEAAQRGAADVGTGPQANESDSFALAEIPQNLPLERLNNPKDRLKAAIKQLAAAQRCLARERERWQQAIVAEESTEVQNAAEARYDTALNDVQEATLIVETREREVLLKPASQGPAIGPLWHASSHVTLEALPAPRPRSVASSAPFGGLLPSEHENGLLKLSQVGASSARLNPLAASFQPHASKTSLTVGPFADVSALEEAPSADISAAPTGRPSRSRDLPPRAPVASHSPHQMAHASSPGLLSPPALSSGALIPRGLAAGRQLETEEEPAAGLGGRGPESAFYASADLEDRQPVPSMEPVNVADVSETGGYGRGGREGSGEAGLTLRRSEAWAPIVEEPEEGGSGPSEMEVGAADMEIMPAGVGEPQRVLKAAEASWNSFGGSESEALAASQLSKEANNTPAEFSEDVFPTMRRDANAAVDYSRGPSALFRQPNASNLLENAAKPVDLPPSQTPSRASGSQLQNKSADPDALNVKARHAALGAITFAGSTEGVKSTPLAAFATGVQGSAQSADLGTLDAARATGVPGQAGGDILKGAPAGGDMESPFSSNVSRGATEKGGFADVTIPLDPARHPVLAALDKRTVARQTAPRGAFPTGPLSTFEVAQGVGLQLAAQAGRKRELPRGFYSGARKASSAAKDVEAVPLNPVAEKIGGTAREVVGDSELPFGSHFPTLDSKKGDETLRTPVYKTAKMSVETGLARISAAPGNSLNKTNSGGSSAVGFPGSKNQGLEAGASDLGQARFTTEVEAVRENESGMEREKEGEEQARERAETAGEEARTKNVDKVYEEVITEPGEDGRETMDASGVKVAEAPAVEHASEANVIESGIEQPLPSQLQEIQERKTNVTNGPPPPGSDHEIWKQSTPRATVDTTSDDFGASGQGRMENYNPADVGRRRHVGALQPSSAPPSQLLRQPAGQQEVAIDGENASKGPVESFMARMVVAAQQEKAGIVSSAHGLDNTDGLAIDGTEQGNGAFARFTPRALQLDDKRAKSHAFTIDMSASADGAGGARKIVGGGSSASSGLKIPARPAKKELATPARRRSSGDHAAKISQSASVRLTLKELKGHDTDVAVIGYESRTRSVSDHDATTGSRSLKRRGSTNGVDRELPAANRQKTGDHNAETAPNTEHAQAAAAIVAPKAALTSSTVLPGDSQGGQMFQGDSSGIQLRKPASAMEDHAPDLKTAEKTGALRAGGAGYGTGAGIRAVQAGPELTPAPLSQEGKAKEAAWFKTEESSGRATWRNNEMYDMETDGEGSL